MFRRQETSQHLILRVVTDKFGIADVSDVSQLPTATNQCYRVKSADGDFFLKQFPSRYFDDRAEDEPLLTDFLREHGVPAVKFIRAADGNHAVRYRGYVYHLQEFIIGEVFARNTAPVWVLPASAEFLARLHRTLQDYRPLPKRFEAGWFDPRRSIKISKYFSGLLRSTRRLPDGEIRDRIRRDLDYKIHRLLRDDQIVPVPQKLTCRNSHGDYAVFQMICGADHIKAIIDLSSACAPPAVWEIIRSYAFTDSVCADGRIDPDNLKDYVRCYMKHMPLSRYDLEMMPHLFHIYLLRKRYGYKEYLAGKSSNRSALLEEGFWSTNLARWFEKNSDALSEELARLV